MWVDTLSVFIVAYFVFQFNFVGKLLGPRGNSLKRLQEETLTKMSILGKGSMRDKAKLPSLGMEQPDATNKEVEKLIGAKTLYLSFYPFFVNKPQTASLDVLTCSIYVGLSIDPITFAEEELRKSGEAKYFHLNDDLHVLIEVFAPPAEAYARMGHALEEIKKFLIPDYNDEIRQAQLQELTYLNGGSDNAEVPVVRGKPPLRTRGGLSPALAR
ncbi:hypothetical protein Chor_002619 [Crotalus horridus]